MTDTDSSPASRARLTVPVTRRNYDWCGHRGPRYHCNRPAGHTGRHLFAHVHLDGNVRAVWGDR